MFVVNMMPQSLSGESDEDSEPNVAVNPLDVSMIAATAFTKDPDPSATTAPIYVTKDGGLTWSLKSIIPDADRITGDVTLRFSASNRLYISHLATGGDVPYLTLVVGRTDDLTFSSTATVISTISEGDQPYVEATTVESGADAGKDRVYVGFSDGWAKMHYSLDAAAISPTFLTVQLEARGIPDGIGYDLAQVRTAIHPSGRIYSAFYSVHIASSTPGTHSVDVVVVRDDQWGIGRTPFTNLIDSDGKAGVRVVANVPLADTGFGGERAGGELSIAVNPRDSNTVYVAWADSVGGIYTVHVARSTDGGQTWPDELRTIPWAQNPALAVTYDGTIGFLYQQFNQTRSGPKWVTHFQTSYRGTLWFDRTLARVPGDAPPPSGNTYIGDYVHLMTVGNNFYGVFCANNRPDAADFPSSVQYQRNADFTTNQLLANDGVTPVPVSIDPFFFKLEELRLLDPRVYMMVVEILFGVINDGGGVIRIGGKIIRVPPWDPEGPWRRIVGILAEHLKQGSAHTFASVLKELEHALEKGLSQ